MAENVRVIVRCRPMNKRERELKCRNIVDIEDCAVSVQNPSDPAAPHKTFTFDSVYDAVAPTEALYNDICYSLVDNVLEGYNGTIFAYGQTGCGKTHTMQGPDVNETALIPAPQRGIISRSFDHIFEAISVASDVRYLALVSYLEIYNENIRDLLNPKEDLNANHALKELPGVGVTVPTLSSHTVHNADECYDLLNIGNRNRMVGATLMNASSSRSHSIFTISLEQIKNSNDDGSESEVTSSGIRRGKLNLVDLAGSERQNKTGAVGERLKEATKINLSLSALGNVISALVDGKTRHIPYRDSKLTRLLQDSLGGNTKTLMISCISPADNNYDETLSTLRYASRAKNISNKPKINEDPKDAKLREYQEEITKLKKMLEANTQNEPETIAAKDDSENRKWLEAERVKLKSEMEQEMERLKEEHTEQQREKDERLHETEQLRNHYEMQLKRLNTADNAEQGATREELMPSLANDATLSATTTSALQLEARKRIELIKKALIGGERANDLQLKERRQKKKLDAQRRLSALAQVLSRIEQNEDRDLLQGHYTNIQQELNVKNEYLKRYRQKVKALEREVFDLQAEFQLDRADYLESIRRLERNLKFYQQLIEKALPILRKDGKYWDPNEIIQNSLWNDDLKIWKLPESSMNSFRLPVATISSAKNSRSLFEIGGPKMMKTQLNDANISSVNNDLDSDRSYTNDNTDVESDEHNANDVYKTNILNNYFRSNRQKTSDITHQRKDYAQRNKQIQKVQRQHLFVATSTPRNTEEPSLINNYFKKSSGNYKSARELSTENHELSSWPPPTNSNDRILQMNKTWGGGSGRFLAATLQNNLRFKEKHDASDDLHSNSAIFRDSHFIQSTPGGEQAEDK